MLKPVLFAFVASTLCSIPVMASAQVASTEDANLLVDKMLDRVNKSDHKGFRELADPDFLKSIPAMQVAAFLSQLHSLGTLSRGKLRLDIGEIREYEMVAHKEGKPDVVFKLVVGAASSTRFFGFGVERFPKTMNNAEQLLTDNPAKSRMDKSVHDAVIRFAESSKFAGMSIGVVDNGRTSFYNYGEQFVGGKELPAKSSIYEIGSITKTFTGILLAQAVLDKKLSLDDDIRLHLPKEYSGVEFNGVPVLIRHLADHTSAIPGTPSNLDENLFNDPWGKYSRSLLLESLGAVKLSRQPGKTFEYSNAAVGLLGHVLETKYQMTYDRLVKKFITGPAKMENTAFELSRDQWNRYLPAYKADLSRCMRWNVHGIEAAGALRSDMVDMLKFAQFNIEGRSAAVRLSHQQNGTISPAPFTTLGLLWGRKLSPTAGMTYNHSGGTGGFSTHILVAPTRKLGVVIMTNTGDASLDALTYEVLIRLLAASAK